ncbi:MAG: polysaccharide biosynthesis protein PslG [Frankiaceae bacterium]|nr:polysaccharide biosynthesis protein PslG [Frankiaceae bacterium]
MSVRFLRRAALLAALVAGAIPAVAHATPAPGIVLTDVPTAGEGNLANGIASLKDTGATWVKVFVPYSDVPKDGNGPFLLSEYNTTFAAFKAAGINTVAILYGSSAGNHAGPADPGEFADFASRVATAWKGNVAGYMVWNEADGNVFWDGAPQAARYTELLKRAYPRIKAADPAATVSFTPLTSGNSAFLAEAYANGAKGSFDVVGIDTDTACNLVSPYSFYRAGDRIAQLTFLGYREVRQVMLDNGDDKPLWLEMGWSTSKALCNQGVYAGQKPGGVSEDDQALYLRQAFHCMQETPYVQLAFWFDLQDAGGDTPDSRFGLLRPDHTKKPAYAAFQDFARGNDTQTGPCGDLEGPAISIKAPTAGQQFTGSLTISASAKDISGLGRITFQADGKEIRNFTADLADDKVVTLDWQGAKQLPLGKHTITVIALDKNGTATKTSVDVTKVDPAALAATAKATFKMGKLHCARRTCSVKGRLAGPAGLSLDGKVQILWQFKNRKGVFKTLHKAMKNANKPFSFKQRLSQAGTWRVQVTYLAKPPFRTVSTPSLRLRVR